MRLRVREGREGRKKQGEEKRSTSEYFARKKLSDAFCRHFAYVTRRVTQFDPLSVLPSLQLGGVRAERGAPVRTRLEPRLAWRWLRRVGQGAEGGKGEGGGGDRDGGKGVLALVVKMVGADVHRRAGVDEDTPMVTWALARRRRER